MALRVVSGQGTAVAFIAVALAFLGMELLGWRAVVRAAGRGSTAATGPVRPNCPDGDRAPGRRLPRL